MGQLTSRITEQAYGIPPEQVVGSSIVSEFKVKDGKPEIVRMPKIDFVNDKAGKPVGIYEHIGRRPILRSWRWVAILSYTAKPTPKQKPYLNSVIPGTALPK